ncbi:MAG: alpha/beta hydrolase [Acidobacteria bacterium]|nr:alpha/beta hydrolase [Acidobacteriota bacterium]
MRTENVMFYSEGLKMSGILRMPDGPATVPRPAIVHGPGFLGLKESKLYERYHEKLIEAGYIVLTFDYRGWGDSEGPRGAVYPLWQVEDIRNAITYLETRPEVDPHRIGLYGSGGTGGANPIYVAGIDPRPKCLACIFPISDGRAWLRSMRREYEWIEFLGKLAKDRQRRVLEGEGELVTALEEVMVETPERRATTVKQDVTSKIPQKIPLKSGEALIEYRPIDVVDRIAPRAVLIVCVEGDAVTPEEQAIALYEKAGEPKKLITLTGSAHYKAYGDYFDELNPHVTGWFNQYLKHERMQVRSQRTGTGEAP